MSPANKAKHFLSIFNGDKQACLELTYKLIIGCLSKESIEYYNEVKQILETNK